MRWGWRRATAHRGGTRGEWRPLLTRSLVWFRSDLRLADNPALAEAIRSPDRDCVGIFLCTPLQWKEHDWGNAKVDFLLRNLRTLSSSLAQAGIPLLVRTVDRFRDVPAELEAAAEEHACDVLLFNHEYEVNERRRDDAVTASFQATGRRVRAFDDQTVVRPGDLRTGQGAFYSVFTPFKKRWLRELSERGLPDLRPRPPNRELAGGLLPDPIPAALTGFEPRRPLDRLWPAGEGEAHARLCRFLDERAGEYDTARDLAGADATSRLSPYLALGVLSVRACLAAALAANRGEAEGGRPGIETWISELIWREFYRHVLVGFPRVSMGRSFKKETESIEWLEAEPQLEAWCEGRTGVPFVDAGMKQLVETGWMHNRLRMVTAMFLAKDLLIDWRHGERFFMQELIDADLANNNGGWQWAASTGTDASPYFRIFNPWRQGRRFDPDATFILQYLPELRGLEPAVIHDPRRLDGALRAGGIGYPEPVVDHAFARQRAILTFKEARS